MTTRGARASFAVTVLAVLTVAAQVLTTACDADHGATPTGTPSTTPAEQALAARPSCVAALPAAWGQAVEDSAVNTGGVSTEVLAVGPAGEVVAVRDNGDTRDLLVIGADKTVTEIYQVPEPNRNDVGSVAVDERWIVVGVDRIPRGSNGVLNSIIRIDVIDRQNGSVRTVAQRSDEDYLVGANGLDTVALFDGKVYWTAFASDQYGRGTGTVRSFDLGTGAETEVASGDIGDVRATATGLTWTEGGRRGYPDVNMWQRAKVQIAAPLPPPVADALHSGPDRLSLATDGAVYAWLTGVDRGGSGVAWWSPDSGLVRVTGDVVRVTDVLPPVYVVGSYVVIGEHRQGDTADQDTFATVVDVRSGAVTFLNQYVAGVDGGTIGLRLRTGPGKLAGSIAGVLRSDALPPIFC
ncbi:MAG: hypothetical protein ACRDUX_26495 [Mycobacterium sp.]